MEGRRVPGPRPIGAQLGIGIQSPGLYIPRNPRNYDPDDDDDADDTTYSENDVRRKKQKTWLNSVDDAIPKNILDFSVIASEEVDTSEGAKVLSEALVNEIDDEMDLLTDNTESDADSNLAGEELHNSSMKWQLGWDGIQTDVPKELELYPSVDIHHNYDLAYAATVNDNPRENSFIPSDIINEMAQKEKANRNNTVNDHSESKKFTPLDPNTDFLVAIGKVLTKADIKNDQEERALVAYRHPLSPSSLIITYMEKENITVQNKEKADSNVIIYRPSQKTYTSITINLNSVIKCIKFSKLAESLGSYSDMVGILTENTLTVIKLIKFDAKENKIDYTLFNPLESRLISDFTIADFDFNPWDTDLIATIDTKGNWSIIEIPTVKKKMPNPESLNLKVKSNHFGSIFDIEEMSNWKRIRWSNNHTRLVVMNESRLIELDFKQNWQQEVIQAKTWSKIRDVVDLNDNFKLILTSREIIVTTINSSKNTRDPNHKINLKREVSWLHNISEDDASLRCRVQKYQFQRKTLFFVYLYSKRFNVVYIHGFSIGYNDTIQSFGVSKIIYIPGIYNIDSIDVETLEINDYYTDSIDLGDITSTLLIYDIVGNKLINYTLNNSANFDNIQLNNMAIERFRGPLVKYPMPNVQALFKELQKEYLYAIRQYRKITRQKQRDNLQEFGYELSQKLNKVIEDSHDVCSKTSIKLQSLMPKIPVQSDLTEIQSFLEQLSEHYSELGLIFTNVIKTLNQIIHEDISTIDVFYNKLLQCWSIVESNDVKKVADKVTKEIVTLTVWNAIKCTKKSDIDELRSLNYGKLSEEQKSIVDQWDLTDDQLQDGLVDDGEASEQIRRPVQFSQYQESQSQIPVIKSSQTIRTRINSQRKSKTPSSQLAPSQASILPSSMSPAFSLDSQPPLLSQTFSQSSQPKKRKKKRMGGFG